MLLMEWRKSNGLSYRKAAEALGFDKAFGATLLNLERGRVFPRPPTAIRISAATNGLVCLQDHIVAWSSAHRAEADAARNAGRIGANVFKLKQQKEPQNGKTE